MNARESGGKQPALLAFGHLVKRLRIAGDLTQEELAERAQISVRSISDLERGTIHRPRRDTVQLLADGLHLRGPDRDAFVALARGRPLVVVPDAVADSSPRYGLTRPPTPVVGRLRETAAVTALLLEAKERLLTLTGPGGVGKTRLALEVAARVGAAFADGVVLVDLSPLRDPDHVLTAIAQALGLMANRDLSPRQAVINALQNRRVLLVLDNFEHLAPAATVVADVLAACPALVVLATSRMPLSIRAEREYPVEPLALPDARTVSALDALCRIPAVDLFIRRAETANGAFALTSANASEVAAITIRLDGLPLAIELAATRIKVLSPSALLARLERCLPLLTGGARDLPARQQTLRATLDWSHELLSAGEQVLFRRLAVFAGGCSLEAAEYVGGAGFASGGAASLRSIPSFSAPEAAQPPPEAAERPAPPQGAQRPTPAERSDTLSVLELLTGLVDKSLLRVHEPAPDERRFGMLETIREYGRERLAAAGEAEAVRDRHLAWCVDLAERAALEIDGTDQQRWFRRLDVEYDNLRVSLGWAIERQNGEPAQRLAAALCQFWIVRGHFEEGRRWLEQALPLAAGGPPVVRASALLGLARLAHQQGDYAAASALHEALALFRDAGDNGGAANTLAALGMLLADQGDLARAAALEEEALAIFRMLGDQAGVVRLLNRRGLDAYDQGDYERATTLLEEALSLGRSLGSWHSVGKALNNLALVAQECCDYEQAMTLQAEALDMWQNLGYMGGIASCLENFAVFIQAQNEPERAMRLYGAAHALRVRIGAPGRPNDRLSLERDIAQARTQLGDDAFDAAWSEGETLSLDEAIAVALG